MKKLHKTYPTLNPHQNPPQRYIAGPRQVEASCTIPMVPTQEAILEEGRY